MWAWAGLVSVWVVLVSAWAGRALGSVVPHPLGQRYLLCQSRSPWGAGLLPQSPQLELRCLLWHALSRPVPNPIGSRETRLGVAMAG